MLGPASFMIFRERGQSDSAWPLTLVSPGLGSLVNLSPPQGRLTHGRGGASLVFPTLENNNPLQPFHSSTLSAKQQNWRLLKPGDGRGVKVGKGLGSKLRQPPFLQDLHLQSSYVYRMEVPAPLPAGPPQKCELFRHQPYRKGQIRGSAMH